MIESLSYSMFNSIVVGKKTEVNLVAVINMGSYPEVESHSHKGCKLKSYNIEYKLHAVLYGEEHGNPATAREFGIAEKRIREWRKQKEQLQQIKESATGRKRAWLGGGGRKTKLTELEDSLLEWVLNRRSNGLHVSRKLIMRKTLFLKESDKHCLTEEFTASRGWLENFMRQNGLSLRRKTTQVQQEPSYLVDKRVAGVLQVRRLF